jgi:hypothetical protein
MIVHVFLLGNSIFIFKDIRFQLTNNPTPEIIKILKLD